jgi:serine/threonine protein kinase
VKQKAGMLDFSCPGCGRRLAVQESLAGRKVRCAGCAAVVDVPPASPANQASGPTSQVSPPAPAGGASSSAAGLPAASGRVPLPGGDGTLDLAQLLAPPQQPGELGRLGHYRVLRPLGAGAMGVVFLGEDVKLARPVALKAMLPALSANPEARARFLREARSAAAIQHDHIVTIYQVDEERGVLFLAMQLLEGETLEDRLRREPHLPLRLVLRIGREIAEGLAAAHARALIHRDIKPANVWLEAGRDRVKILDFGLARAAGDDARISQTGTVIGTPAYMAPEQARGEVIGTRADLFSLGCVLYRLCTGELPFKGKDTLAVLSALAVDRPVPVEELNPTVPPDLADLIARLLSKDPGGRPASARAVADKVAAIEQTLLTSATLALPPGSAPVPRAIVLEDTGEGDEAAPSSRRLLGVLADVLAVALLGSGLYFLIRVLVAP